MEPLPTVLLSVRIKNDAVTSTAVVPSSTPKNAYGFPTSAAPVPPAAGGSTVCTYNTDCAPAIGFVVTIVRSPFTTPPKNGSAKT